MNVRPVALASLAAGLPLASLAAGLDKSALRVEDPEYMKINVVDRQSGQTFEEKVMGEATIRRIYETEIGKWITNRILVRKWLSDAYGHYQSSRFSARAIPGFTRDFAIKLDEFEPGPFRTFNDFFIRKFLPGKRNFASEPNRLPAFAEGRYLAFPEVTDTTALPIKGALLDGPTLLHKKEWVDRFLRGPGYIARLCPVDYHRFHFPDDGEVVDQYRVEGPLHSVNPIALKANGRILFENERVVTILKTKNFGHVAMIEVGALCVGRIQQSHNGRTFERGQEKGYFLFGGSTVILVGERGRFEIDADLVKNTQQGLETYILLGDAIASAKSTG